jgi:hypothetical protein
MNILSREELAYRTPSVMTVGHAENLSERYKQFATIDVVDALYREGWMPTRAKQSYSKLPSGRMFAKHMVNFTHTNALSSAVGSTFPQLVLTNSHDGATAFKVEAGLFRLACSNGLVVSNKALEAVSVRHFGKQNTFEAVMGAAMDMAKRLPLVVDTVRRMENTPMDTAQSIEFAENAALTRWEKPDFAPARLLATRRTEDRKVSSLWNVFNIVQENLVRGGVQYLSKEHGGRNRVREIKSVDSELSINRKLWELAEDFCLN